MKGKRARMTRTAMWWGAGLAAAAIGFGATAAQAETVVLETTALRLELTTEPYGYRVLEKPTGEVLLVHSATTFIAAGEPAPAPDAGRPDGGSSDGGDALADAAPPPPPADVSWKVTRATVGMRTAEALTAELALEGTSNLARVQLRFDTPETLDVQLALDRPGVKRVREEFQDQQERIHGIWEYPFEGRLDSRGLDRPYLGFGRQTGSLYTSARAPFYMTSRRYGVYVRSNALGRFSVGVAGKTGFGFDGSGLRYTVIHGRDYYQLLERYTAIAGGAFMPPLWALGGVWWADDFHRDLRNAANAQQNVIDLATQLQQRRIPAAGLLVDRPFGTGFNGWGNLDWAPSFPDPAQMVTDLHARGLELVLWIANRAWNGLYLEGQAQGLLFPGSENLGPAADLRLPAAEIWWKAKLAPFVELGVKGYKIDRGEQNEHPDSVQTDNVTRYARLAQESLAAKHGNEGFVFARNVADSGRKHTAIWNGDSEANFTGLAYSIAAGLRSGLIGMPIWGSDTGGYLRNDATPSEEVFARWLGFSAYSPMMEVLVGDGHTPWYDYSPALVDIARKHATAHHDLIPYVRSYLHAAVTSGAPVMRAMLLDLPDDTRVAGIWDQYLFGAELLVAPVVTAGATGRSVLLPPGGWLDYNGRRQMARAGAEGLTVQAEAPLDTIPVFVREGAIVVRGDILRGNNNWTPDWRPRLRVEIFPGVGAMARSFVYFTGSRPATITAATDNGKLTITLPALELPGDLEVQIDRAGRVLRDGQALVEGTDYQMDRQSRVLRIPFTGAASLVIDDVGSLFDATADPLAPAPDAAVPDAAAPMRDAPVASPDAATANTSTGGGCRCDMGGATRSGIPALLCLLAAFCWIFRRRIRPSKV
jgi:alpha-D-xyloside xylohydrolase